MGDFVIFWMRVIAKLSMLQEKCLSPRSACDFKSIPVISGVYSNELKIRTLSRLVVYAEEYFPRPGDNDEGDYKRRREEAQKLHVTRGTTRSTTYLNRDQIHCCDHYHIN